MLASSLIFLLLQIPPASGSDVPDPLEISAEMEEFLEREVGRGLPPLERLERLVDRVFRSNGLGFRYEPVTRTAIGTFTHRSGNCLSFTNMLVAMARHLGLDVKFREVEEVPTWESQGGVFLVSQHINLVAYVGGQPFLVDLLPEVGRIEIGGRTVRDERGLAHFLNNLGAEQLAANDPDRARWYFKRALQADPTAAFVWANLGVAQAHLGLFGEAEKSYFQSLRIDENNLVAVSNLADLYSRLGRKDQARSYAKKAESFRRKNPYYHFNLGESAYRSGVYTEAVRHYRAAIRRKSTEHRFHFAIAKAYAQLGDNEKAVSSLRKAQRYAPDESGRLKYHQKLELLAANVP